MTENKNARKVCARCNKNKPLVRNYYTADENLYSDGRFTICKSCVEDIINEKGFNGFITILRAMNRPFIQDIWKGDYKDYITQISSLHQYRGMTFDDSVYSNPYGIQPVDADYDEDDEFEITPEMRRFWRGFDDHEIRILEDYYQELISSYECETPVQRSLYRNMAITQYKADNATTTKEFEGLMNTLSKLMNDANVKPAQELGTVEGSISTWGEWVAKIEETEPIPEPRDEFKDVDGIRKYINEWFIDHFARIFGIKKDMPVESTLDEGDA